MGLIGRFLTRIRSDGILIAINLTVKFLTGLNFINLYNAFVFREYTIATSCDISTCLPRSTELPHPVGVVIGYDVDIGSNVLIRQNVTVGRSEPDPDAGYPTISDNVSIGAGTVILGDVDLGEGCTTGANSVVVDDVAPHTTVVGVPAEEK
jgi:serine acetyltransferase